MRTARPWQLLTITLVFAGVGAGPRSAALIDAARHGDAEAIRAMVRNAADANTAEADGTTLLHWVIRADAVEATEVMPLDEIQAALEVRARAFLFFVGCGVVCRVWRRV